MFKSFVRAGVLLLIGAGLGIWFAPSNAKEFLHKKAAVAQDKAVDFNANTSSKWLAGAQKTLNSASKHIDLKKLNREEFSKWMQSVQSAYATVSEQAVKTQKGINAVNQYLEGAKTEYKKHRDKITELERRAGI